MRKARGLGLIDQRIDQATRHPPQGTSLRQLVRHRMDRIERRTHLLEGVRLPADPGEDRALPARALRLQKGGELADLERLGARMRRRGRREIREKELDLAAVLASLELRELAIARIEPQRHVRIAPGHVVHELLQLEGRAVEDGHRLIRRGSQAGDARLECFAKACGAGEADHAEGTAHLVEVLGAAGHRRGIDAALRAGRELLSYALERLVDLDGNPGKDGGIGHAVYRR